MSRSDEWYFRLGPLVMGVGIRTGRLDDAVAGVEIDIHPPGAPSSVGRLRELGPGDPPAELLVWEAEGGNLG